MRGDIKGVGWVGQAGQWPRARQPTQAKMKGHNKKKGGAGTKNSRKKNAARMAGARAAGGREK